MVAKVNISKKDVAKMVRDNPKLLEKYPELDEQKPAYTPKPIKKYVRDYHDDYADNTVEISPKLLIPLIVFAIIGICFVGYEAYNHWLPAILIASAIGIVLLITRLGGE